MAVDSDLLGEVDSFVRENGGATRSKVFDEALRCCWIARRQEIALREQFDAPRSPEEKEELRRWREIQAAQFPHLLRRYEQRNREE